MLDMIIRNPGEYCRKITCEENGETYEPVSLSTGRPLSFFEKLRRKLIGGYYCWKEHGFVYTFNNLLGKIKRRIMK